MPEFTGITAANVTAKVTAMATANVTVSLDPAVIALAKQQARTAGLSMSAWVAKTIRAATIAESARRYDLFERESGDADHMAIRDSEHPHGCRLAGAEWRGK